MFCLFTVISWKREWCFVCSLLFLGSVSGVLSVHCFSWKREWCFVCSLLFLGSVSGVLSVHCYFLEA